MTNEATVQDQVRLAAAELSCRLWRNNSGAMYRQDGGFIRFGLASDVPKVASSDLVGITPVKIQQHHVGQVLGIFTGVEVKASGWKFSGNKHESEQIAFLKLVHTSGGYAGFASSVNDYYRIIGATP